MNIKKAIVIIFVVVLSIAGWALFGAYTRYGLAWPVIAGYALLFSVILVVSSFSDRIKRWMK